MTCYDAPVETNCTDLFFSYEILSVNFQNFLRSHNITLGESNRVKIDNIIRERIDVLRLKESVTNLLGPYKKLLLNNVVRDFEIVLCHALNRLLTYHHI